MSFFWFVFLVNAWSTVVFLWPVSDRGTVVFLWPVRDRGLSRNCCFSLAGA